MLSEAKHPRSFTEKATQRPFAALRVTDHRPFHIFR